MVLPITVGSLLSEVVQNLCVRTAAPAALGPSSLRVQQAAEHGAKAHHVEERSADDARFHHARLAAETNHREVDRREVAERADGGDARLDVVDFRHGERRVLGADARRALTDVDQAIFVAIDERAEEHAADDAEDRGVGADAEGERHHDGGGQALGAQKSAQGEPDVPDEGLGRVDPARAPDASHRIARERDVAEFLQRRQARGGRILAALDPFLDADRQMAANLVVEVVLVGPHLRYSLLAGAGFITRPIASTSCDHRSCSRDSWAFPAAVSR